MRTKIHAQNAGRCVASQAQPVCLSALYVNYASTRSRHVLGPAVRDRPRLTEWVYSTEQHIRHPCRKVEGEKWNGKSGTVPRIRKGLIAQASPAGSTIWSRWASVRAGAVSALRQEEAVVKNISQRNISQIVMAGAGAQPISLPEAASAESGLLQCTPPSTTPGLDGMSRNQLTGLRGTFLDNGS
jgi:hypothetical protein